MSEGTENQPAETVEDEIESVMADLDEEETKTEEESEEATDEEVSEEEEPEEASEEQSEDEESEEELEDEEEKLEAPQHWSAEDRASFDNAPRDVQEWALRRDKEREADYTRKTQEIADVKKRAEVSEEIWAPLRQSFAMMGLDEVTAQRQLAQVYQSLQTNPTETVMWLAQQYGVDFQQPEQGEIDPALQSVNEKVQRLESQIANDQQAQQLAAQQQASAAINAFKDAKDESGNPKYPHFENVKEVMGQLMTVGTAESLEDAYDKAIRLNPELFNSIQQVETEARAKEEAEKAKAAKKAAAAKARKAANGVKSGTTGKKAPESLSIEDEVRAQIEQAYG